MQHERCRVSIRSETATLPTEEIDMSETTATSKSPGSSSSSGSSAKSKPAASEVPRLVEAFSASQKMMWEAMESARKRSIRVNDILASSFAKDREGMASLTRRMASNPRDYKGNFAATVEAMTDSQSRSLDLAKAMLVEYTQSREAALANARELYASGKEIAAATIDAAQSWGSVNPFAESFKKTFAGFTKVTEAARAALA